MRRAAAAAVLALLGGFAAPALAQPATPPAGSAEPPVFAMRGGRPTVNLGPNILTIQPVLRLDADIGGFFGQDRFPDDRPPRLGDGDRPGVPANGMNMRRARLGVTGNYLRDFTYTFAWEFAPGPGAQFDIQKGSRIFELQTAYTGFRWITPRVGAFTLNHTIEYAMSSFELPLLERPAISNIAASLASGDTRFAAGGEARGERWFASAYLTDGVASALNDHRQRGVVARANALALNQDRLRVAVGANFGAQFHPGTVPGPESIRLRDHPELRLDPTRLLDTRAIRAGSGHALGPELAALVGPVYLQAEYQWLRVDANNNLPNQDFHGYYVTAAVPLMGPPRRWDRARGVFTRPDFRELDAPSGHWGWAELAARWSYVSLNDGATTRGGRQGILSVAANYYPWRRVRVSLQYSNGSIKLDGPDRDFQSLAGRLAFNW